MKSIKLPLKSQDFKKYAQKHQHPEVFSKAQWNHEPRTTRTTQELWQEMTDK